MGNCGNVLSENRRAAAVTYSCVCHHPYQCEEDAVPLIHPNEVLHDDFEKFLELPFGHVQEQCCLAPQAPFSWQSVVEDLEGDLEIFHTGIFETRAAFYARRQVSLPLLRC